MAKSSKSKSTTTEKAKKDVLGVMKNSGVTKATSAVANSAKNIAKAIAPNLMEVDKESKKSGKKDKKSKKAKTPTPEPESDSSSSDSSSESESDSEEEAKPTTKKAAPAKAVAAKKDADSDSDSSDSSSDDEEEKKPAAKEDSSDSDSDSSSDDEEEAKPATKAKVNGAAAEKKAAKSDSDSDTSSDSSSDEEMADAKVKAGSDSSDSSDSDSSDDDEEEKKEPEPKKRKAAVEEVPATKKVKTETEGGEEEGSKTLFVGRLSWNVDEEWLRQEFESYGAQSARVVTDRDTQKSKGYGYIDFGTHAEAAKALAEKQGLELDGREINLDFSQSKPKANPADRASKFGDSQSPPTDTLFIGNLSFDADESLLSSEFESFGTITSVRIPTDRETGNMKGFAYVTFSSIDEAKAACEAMNGASIANRAIRTDFSQPRSNDGGRGGGSGGFGGGRGGGRGGSRGGFGGGRGGGRGGFGGGRGGDRGGRGGGRGGRGGSSNRGGFGDFKGKKTTFD